LLSPTKPLCVSLLLLSTYSTHSTLILPLKGRVTTHSYPHLRKSRCDSRSSNDTDSERARNLATARSCRQGCHRAFSGSGASVLRSARAGVPLAAAVAVEVHVLNRTARKRPAQRIRESGRTDILTNDSRCEEEHNEGLELAG